MSPKTKPEVTYWRIRGHGHAAVHDIAHDACMTLPPYTRMRCSRWRTDRSRSLFSLVASRDGRREHVGSSLFDHARSEISAPFLHWEEDPGRHTCTCAQEMGGNFSSRRKQK